MKHLTSFSIYAVTIFLNAAISFITFSLLTHYLNEVDYGIINLYNSCLIFLTPFISSGMQFILAVDFFKMDERSFSRHFTNAGVIPVFSCLFITLLVLVFHNHVQNFIHVNFFFALLLPLAGFMSIYSDVILTLIRDKGRHWMFSIYSIFKTLVEISLTITLVIFLGMKWQGRLAGSILTLAIMSILIIYIIRRWKLYTGVVDPTAVKKIFFLGLPFIPERLAIFILGYSDRFFINFYKGTGDVGLYSAGAQIALIVNLGILTLSNVFYPSIYKALSQDQMNYGRIRKIVLGYIGISACIAVGVIATTPLFFKYFVGPRFRTGQQYAVYLTIGLFFWAIYNVFLAFLLNSRKNKMVMSISIAAMALSVGLNFFFVGRFGALGATYTAMIVYFFMAITTVFMVSRYFDLRLIFGKAQPKSIEV